MNSLELCVKVSQGKVSYAEEDGRMLYHIAKVVYIFYAINIFVYVL